MSRVKRGFKARRRRKKVLKLARGYRERRHSAYRRAVETLQRALAYQYRHRKEKKREFRKLWIIRINAEARKNGLKYSQLIALAKKIGMNLDRKNLAHLATHNPNEFQKLIDFLKVESSKKEDFLKTNVSL